MIHYKSLKREGEKKIKWIRLSSPPPKKKTKQQQQQKKVVQVEVYLF